MRIRKRPPAAVEVARAAPVLKEIVLWRTVPGVQHDGRALERHTNGSLESSRSVSEEARSIRRDGCEGEENSREKHEETSSGGAAENLLMKSLLVVFERVGYRGLTTREAVAKLEEYDLPGLQEGSHERSSVQVAKVLRTSELAHLEGGKYFVCFRAPEAVVAESSTQSEAPPQHAISKPRNSGRRKRAAQKLDDTSAELSSIGALHLNGKAGFMKRRRRPPSSLHELAIGPRQCKRYDGRGWQCTRETEEGFSFCEHHQALMNKRKLRLNLAKVRRSCTIAERDMDLAEPQVKARSLKSIK